MKKVELLSPAGNMEALKQAIHHGADAVYLGGKKFGARKFADNFDHTQMKEAIDYGHLYGVKIYVTMNTLVYDEEVEDFVDEIEFLYRAGVDAIIMQDLGMIGLVRNLFPELEIHASTQMHNHNRQGLQFLAQWGIRRAVLARELTLEEIRALDVDIEKEVFIHGALCICYSGCCLYSSMVGGRSGNRGECAGSCRLPYELYEEDTPIKSADPYLLSTRELNTSRHLKELLESGITSFKIEGRMKSAEYVGLVTQFYRELIDQYYETGDIVVDPKKVEELQVMFYREFTEGHLFQVSSRDLMNMKSPNHIGIGIGNVIEVTKERILIQLSKELNQGDGIRFLKSQKGMMVNFLYDTKGLLISKAEANTVVQVDNKIGLSDRDLVHKTFDCALIQKLQNDPPRKIPISMQVRVKMGEPLVLTLEDGIHSVQVTGAIVTEAKTSPMGPERILQQLSKMGNTPFVIEQWEVEVDDNIFVSIQEINQLRRDVVDRLIQKRITVKLRPPRKQFHLPTLSFNVPVVSLSVLTRTKEQLEVCLLKKIDRIYTTDWDLYQQYRTKGVFYAMPRVCCSSRIYDQDQLLVTELGGLSVSSTNNVLVSDYTMNVVNYYSAYFLHQCGVSCVTLSEELTKSQSAVLLSSYRTVCHDLPPIEKIIYGRIDLMIMKYCPVSLLGCPKKGHCTRHRSSKQYYLKDRRGVRYPLLLNGTINELLSSKRDAILDVPEYLQQGVTSFRLELFDESESELVSILNRVHTALKK